MVSIPDCISGSLQGVIRALDAQKRASFIAMGAYYLVTIPVACILIFQFKLGVGGLWAAMGLGTLLQAFFYVRLVTTELDWQNVADSAIL